MGRVEDTFDDRFINCAFSFVVLFNASLMVLVLGFIGMGILILIATG